MTDNEKIAKFMGYSIELTDPEERRYRPKCEGTMLFNSWILFPDFQGDAQEYLWDIYSKMLLYDKSWDWLMEAVNKIESLDLGEYGYSWEHEEATRYNNGALYVEITKNVCIIYMEHELDPPTYLVDVRSTNKLKATYEATIKFINYYNNLIFSQK